MSKVLRLGRAIDIADFILEGDGHSTTEAADEFVLSKTSIERELRYLGQCAFYPVKTDPQIPQLQRKFLNAKKTLKKVAIRNYSLTRNQQRAASN